MSRRWLCFILLLGIACSLPFASPERVGDFRLLTNRGDSFQLYRAEGEILIVAGYSDELDAVMEKWEAAPEHIYFLDERVLIPKGKTAHPILLDPAFVVAESLSLKERGDAVLLRGGTGELLNRTRTEHLIPDLAPIADSNREELSPDYPEFTYVDHVAPIVAERCISCHRQGGIAPFPFRDIGDLLKRRKMIEEVVMTGRMPPWEVEPGHLSLHPGPSLTPLEKRALVSWAKSNEGLPLNVSDPLKDSTLALPEGGEWAAGVPDIILTPPGGFDLAAEGNFDYRYVTYELDLQSDSYLIGAQLISNEPRAVHHLLGFTHRESQFELTELYQSGTVIAMSPPFSGSHGPPVADGGILLKKGSKLTLQYHLTSFGRKAKVIPKLGLYITTDKPRVLFELRGFQNTEIDIPPGEPNYRSEAGITLERGTRVYGFQPHMHYRGRSATLFGDDQVIVRIPNYNFDWQYSYWFKEPVRLERETVFRFEGRFDNSASNPRNPDPRVRVKFGDQANDEMLLGTLVVTTSQESVASSHQAKAESFEDTK